VGWLSGFSYRKSHVINSASGAGTNYPVKITCYYGTGTDSGGSVYLNSHSRTDFGDVRFTTSDGTTLLDYWMESYTASNNAVFWVEVADDLSSSNATIYVYYGKSSATRADNPQNIDLWQLREHQKYTTFYPNITFTKPTGSVIRIDSYTAGASSMGQGYVFIIMPKSYLNGKKVQLYWNVYFSYADTRDLSLGRVIILNTELKRQQTLGINDIENLFTYIEATHYPSPLGTSGWKGWATHTSDVLDLSTFTSNYVTLMIRLIDGWANQTVMVDVDWLKILDASNNVLLTFNFDQSVVMEQTDTYEDYGLYRKYVSPEPSHGSWGSEEISQVIKTVVEYLGLNDVTNRLKSLYRTITEYLGMLDNKLISVYKSLIEYLGLIDNIIKEKIFEHIKSVIEYLELTDIKSKSKFVYKYLIEHLWLTDMKERIKSIRKSIIEYLVLNDIIEKIKISVKKQITKIIVEHLGLNDVTSVFKSIILGRMTAVKNSLMNKIANSTTYPITIVDEWRLNTWSFNAWTGTLVAVKIIPSSIQCIHYGYQLASKTVGPCYLYHFNINVISRYVEFDIGESTEPIHAKTAMNVTNDIIKYLRKHNTDENAGVLDIINIKTRETETSGATKGVHMSRIMIEGDILTKRPMEWLK